MSIDAIFPKKNVGSSTSPIWEEFVYKTLANSVYMDDTFDKTLTDNIDELVNTLDNKVSKEQTINNQPLSSNITLTAENVGAISALEKGTSNGIAELDETGKVPVSQLPSYVDDVIEGYYHNGKFYQDLGYETELENNSNKIYVDFLTEKIYRWSGSMYIEISPSLILGEISSTAFRGDRGKIAYEHSQSLHAPTDAEKNIITSIQINGENIEPNAERAVNIIIPDFESINTNIGTLSNLTTTDKDNLVEAINEVNSGLNDVKANVEDIENSEIVLLDSFLDNYTSFKNKLVLYTFDGSGLDYDERDNCAYYDSKGNYYGFDINIKMITVGEDSIIDIFSDITLNEEFFIIHYERDGLGAPQSINDLPIGDNDYYLFKDIDSNSFDLENGKYYLAAVTKYMVDGGIDPGEAGIVTVYGEIYPNAILAIENRKTEYNLKSTNTNIGTLSNLTTTNKDNLVEAINEVNADITSINGDISDITTNIGTIANLHTTEKDNLVDAINSASIEIINEIPPVSPTTPTYSKSESCTLDKNEYYCYMDLTSLSLSLNVSNETSADYISSVTFTSGETATSINYPDTIHWVTGSEDVIDGVFAPIPNRRYTLTFFTDGWVICGIVNSVEVTEDDKPASSVNSEMTTQPVKPPSYEM